MLEILDNLHSVSGHEHHVLKQPNPPTYGGGMYHLHLKQQGAVPTGTLVGTCGTVPNVTAL
jgi:hypothetical protein